MTDLDSNPLDDGFTAGGPDSPISGMEFRKKPIVITALQVPAMGEEPSTELHELVLSQNWEANDDGIAIPTLEGVHLASPLDWIIRGIKGEYYPCKPDIFAATYDDNDNPPEDTDEVTELRTELANALSNLEISREDTGKMSENYTTAHNERDQANEDLASMRVILADNLAEIKRLNAMMLDQTIDPTVGKTLHNSDIDGARKNVKDIVVVGNGDMFQLLCKASSKAEGWMKSTKGMQFAGGALVQVSTQQRNPDGSYVVAEALAFVPNVTIIGDVNDGRKLKGR